METLASSRAPRKSGGVTPFGALGALAEHTVPGITIGMKTAISVPDEVFEKAEATAKRLKISRSELYSRALQEFLDTHSPDRVTAAWDAVVAELGQPDTSVSAPASRRVFETTEW
jgi:predicted transcriptional regulator